MSDPDVPRLRYRPSSGAGSGRATALGRGTHGVPDVRRLVETQFNIAFPHRVWVAGQVARPSVDADGTVRFPLRSSTTEEEFSLPCVVPGETVPVLRDLLQRGQDADLEDVVREGRLARVGGLLRFDVQRGSVALVVSDLDTTPTALGLAEERERLLRHVTSSGLAERQRILSCVTAPRAVTLIGDARDGALDRVAGRLAASGFDVRLQVLPLALDTPAAPRRLAEAVRTVAERSDLVLLVRDEGRPLRLSTYDGLDAARAVADAPVPVLTGLGGEGVVTACDQVAFAALPTADAAADWLLARLTEARRALHALRDEVGAEVAAAGERARSSLAEVRAEVEAAGEQAHERAEAARGRRRLLLYGGAALLAALVVAAVVLAGQPLLLLGLLLPAALLAGAKVQADRARTRGSREMAQRDDDFARVLQRLRGVKEELAGTSSPDKVAGLRDLANRLVAEGERLLHRHLDERPAVEDGGSPAGTALAGAVPAQPGGLAPSDEQVVLAPGRSTDPGATAAIDLSKAPGAPASPGNEEAQAGDRPDEDAPDAATQVLPTAGSRPTG